jgi:hypothetical protein
MFTTSKENASPQDGGAKISADDAIKLVRCSCCFPYSQSSFAFFFWLLFGFFVSSILSRRGLVSSRYGRGVRRGDGWTRPGGCSGACNLHVRCSSLGVVGGSPENQKNKKPLPNNTLPTTHPTHNPPTQHRRTA